MPVICPWKRSPVYMSTVAAVATAGPSARLSPTAKGNFNVFHPVPGVIAAEHCSSAADAEKGLLTAAAARGAIHSLGPISADDDVASACPRHAAGAWHQLRQLLRWRQRPGGRGRARACRRYGRAGGVSV